MDYNLFGAVRVTNAFLDILKDKKDGKVVYTASVAGLKAGSKKPHYHAAKSALINFAKSVAQECGPFNVNVNVVNPGWVYTPIYENLIDVVKNPAWGDAYKDWMLWQNPSAHFSSVPRVWKAPPRHICGSAPTAPENSLARQSMLTLGGSSKS